MRYCHLIFLLLFSLALDRVDTDLFVVLLKSGQIFTSLREFTLFHTLSDVPVDESSLGVHQVKLMIKTSPGLGDGGGVAQHAHGTLYLGQITSGYDSWWLVVDTDLETSWTPVNELDGSLGLDGSNGGVDVLGDDVTSVQHTAGHVLAVTWVTFHHLVGWFESGVGDFGDRELFVVGLFGRDDRGICCQREVDTWVWYQVGLELSQVDVESTIKSQRGSD